MALLGIDLGGTKVAVALFDHEGNIRARETINLDGRTGGEVGRLITVNIVLKMTAAVQEGDQVEAIGISVPGISRQESGTVWAPNIPGWDDYPLYDEIKSIAEEVPVVIESDRSCYISGEVWRGNAAGCDNAIFLAVGTGIGAGITVNGELLRGADDIAGAIGWMALSRPFRSKYTFCGNFEYFASGEGIARQAAEYVARHKGYQGVLKKAPGEKITTRDVFEARENGDVAASSIIELAVEYWGMATANLVSLFNPEKIIFGGGVFGPARVLIPEIRGEAAKWAQPISMKKVSLEPSALEGDAGVYGAGYLAKRHLGRQSYLL